MERITFEIKSLLKFKLALVEYPELSSKKKWVQKGINVLKQYAPGMLNYLSKEYILARLKEFDIVLRARKKTTKKRARLFFKIWLKKEKAKRLFLIVLEALIIPFTGILALLPGPNFFFYVPALLFYYHLTSYRGLRKIDADELHIDVIRY